MIIKSLSGIVISLFFSCVVLYAVANCNVSKLDYAQIQSSQALMHVV